MPKKLLATTIILTSILALVIGMQVVEVVDANPAPYDSSGTSNVEVSIISPQNKTYDSNNIELIVNFGAYPGVWYKGYSLDGSSYIEITPGHLSAHNLTETLSLSQLSKGSHSIEVKAYAMANDEDGKVIACSKVNFAITKTLETVPSSSPTPTPIEVDTIDSSILNQPTLTAITIVIVIAAVVSISLVYFGRRKGKP